MVREIRYFRLPVSLLNNQNIDGVTTDLYLTETGEIEVEQGTVWDSSGSLDNNLLTFCTKGEGIVLLAGEQIPISRDQFFIVPRGGVFKFYSSLNSNTRFLLAGFNGKKVKQLKWEPLVVRNLVPSVNNLVANREMLFDEIFNNLSKGFHDQKISFSCKKGV